MVGLSYDVQGNLANKNGQGHQFDYGNRLREVAGKETYRYDSNGWAKQAKQGSEYIFFLMGLCACFLIANR